jgi:glyoxylase-like metal-dependent hydrolase (beta-lactamase superfamily II)
MNNSSFRFDVGTFRCIVVSDGTIDVTGPEADSPHEIMDVMCLLIQKGLRTILVDTGCGEGFQGTAGKLAQNLHKEGINPSDIDTIVYTHGHIDHVGGTIDSRGNPVYPKARQVVLKREWDCWVAKPKKSKMGDMFALARKTLVPLAAEFDKLEDNAEVVPGVKLIPAPGHTLGSTILEISSEKKNLLCIGDLVHSQIELTDPEYYAWLDSAPEAAVKLRTVGLSKIVESGDMVFACHFPFPGIGHFIKKGGVLSWQPITG